MLRTWFIIIMAFKNVLFNRNTGLLQTFQKHQLASVEETSQEGCTPSVKVLISAKRDFLPNHILCLENNKNPFFDILFQSPHCTHPEQDDTKLYFQANPSLEFFQR